MKLTALRAAAVAAVLAFHPALASDTACPDAFVGGQAPDVTNPKVAAKTVPLCFREFSVLHSGVSRTPLWSAERLTRARIESARGQERVNLFHEEGRLPPGDRSTLEDFKRSGWDRGHLSPSADFPDPESQEESFSLANMVPQAPANNRGVWERIERAVRELTLAEGEVYVVTGPVFQGASLQRLNGRVLIPSQMYKAVYVPGKRAAGVYVTENAPGEEWQAVSVSKLRELIGLDVFPALPEAVKERTMELPEPDAGGKQRRRRTSS